MLVPQVEGGVKIVGLEPSCILTFRDELPDLTRDPRARVLAENSLTLEEFLASLPDWRPGRLEGRATVHGHCHQKALVGMEPTEEVLRRVEGLDFRILDSGCCGMAGSFGYEEGHYEVSRAAGERVLFPAVREAPGDLVVAPGFSCRSQIADFCDGRRAIHTAELLAMADGTGRGKGERGKRERGGGGGDEFGALLRTSGEMRTQSNGNGTLIRARRYRGVLAGAGLAAGMLLAGCGDRAEDARMGRYELMAT